MITSRERILRAFAHEQSDRIPVFDVANNPELYTQMLGAPNESVEGGPVVELARCLGLDAAMVPVRSYTGLIPRQVYRLGTKKYTDGFGVGYTVSDSSWPLGIATEERQLDERFLDDVLNAKISDEDLDPIYEALKVAHSHSEDEIALFGGIRSAFSFLFISGGIVGLSLLIYENPELLEELVKASTSYWTRVGLKLIDMGVDALYVANDMGMNGSTIISPDHLRTFFLLEFANQCEVWRDAKGKVILHSCGNINGILDDLSQMCIDGINNLQTHAGMDIVQVYQSYGDKWTIIGNVDATSVMTSSRIEDIDDALENLIDSVSAKHGLILATDHSFHKGIPVERVYHFVKRAKELGKARGGE